MFDAHPLDVALPSGTEVATASWARGWETPAPITVSDWADKYRILPREGAAEPGPWRTARAPYLREIMDCLSAESPVRRVTIRKSTQVGGTEVGINWLSYIVEHNPGPTMYVLPTLDMARKFSEHRFAPIIELMPCLRERIGPATSRTSGNTLLSKKFPAGMIIFSGANSANSLATMPIKNLVLDESSKYPGDLDDQGSAEEQAIRRTSTFTRRKILDISSPTVKDACAIDRNYDDGDQSQLWLPCPHCAKKQVLHIDQITDDGSYLCIGCGQLVEEHHKPDMLAAGEWIARKPERSLEHRSFEVWAAYANIGLGYTWKEIADMRAKARKDPSLMPTFVNTILGESYEGASQKVESSELAQRAGKWQRRTLPRGALILTAGVDVQVNRFAVQVVAWGRNEQAWIVDYVELPADPTRREDWSILWDYLAQPLINACGIQMRIAAACVDSGNWTQEVYTAVRPLQAQGVMAIKGSKDAARPVIGRASKQDADKRGRTIRKGINLWLVGVNTAKTTLMQRLLGDADREEEARLIHFPGDLPEDYYRMLTAERFDLTAKRWVKKSGARNEALDTFVYAYAAALSPNVRIHLKRDADWATLEAKLEPGTDDLFVARPVAAPLPASAAPAIAPARQDVQPSSAPRGTTAPAANPFASADWMSR
ncbi:MAG TPA: phage terminase large subunit family protein [Frateuria sp.]|uniref:phage terminase large subunit family protein n=1 Tax=Frateuria sp. TaxID=2211372 RepID=UPI002D7E45C4|nr:phage terminase large subunit family protein [Frateuria sp.]HET6806895.1 phage terminase large subunit family protein [Frateuria sp.]